MICENANVFRSHTLENLYETDTCNLKKKSKDQIIRFMWLSVHITLHFSKPKLNRNLDGIDDQLEL